MGISVLKYFLFYFFHLLKINCPSLLIWNVLVFIVTFFFKTILEFAKFFLSIVVTSCPKDAILTSRPLCNAQAPWQIRPLLAQLLGPRVQSEISDFNKWLFQLFSRDSRANLAWAFARYTWFCATSKLQQIVLVGGSQTVQNPRKFREYVRR